MSLDPLENIRALREREKRAMRDENVSVPWPGGSPGGSGAGGITGLADTIPEITDQTGAAGTATTARRSDCKPKLPLAGSPGDGTAAEGNATLQFATGGKLQVRKAGYAAGVAALDDVAGADGTGGLGLPVDTSGGLDTNAGGGGKLAVKADADAGNILSVGASGVLVNALASTSKRGLAPSLTAPAAGLRNILAIDNGETVLKVTALFDTTNPEAPGVPAPGTSLLAAHRDHVHAAQTISQVFVDLEPSGEWDYDDTDLTADGDWHELDLSGLVTDATCIVLYCEFDSQIVFRAPGASETYGVKSWLVDGSSVYGGLIVLPIPWGADAIEYKVGPSGALSGGMRLYGYSK